MSFYRFIYYCAMIGGWCAFVGWLAAECLPMAASQRNSMLQVVLMAAMVGAGIGGGLSSVAGTGKGRWHQRLLPGLAGGLLGGAIGGLMGDVLYSAAGLPRWIGWMIMGLCIGSIEGAYERSRKKLRNGLIGGGLGGVIGGLLFDLVASGGGMTSRAAGFVILGLAIGCLIGLVQVVFREAWLTVLDGYRPGRQVILSQAQTVLGRGEWVALPFMGSFGSALEAEHLCIVRQADGSYRAEDKGTKSGSQVNQQVIEGSVPLADGDVIRIGNNLVRFNEKVKRDGSVPQKQEGPPPRPMTQSPAGLLPPPKPTQGPGSMAAPPPPKPTKGAGPIAAPPPKPSQGPAVAPPPPAGRPVGIAPPPPKPSGAGSMTAPTPPLGKPAGVPPPPAKPSGTAPAPPPVEKPAPPKPTPPPAAGKEDACPACGRKVPGTKGSRYCMVCDLTF